jgi:hypothetical protein
MVLIYIALFVNPCIVSLSLKQQWSYTICTKQYVVSQQYEIARLEEIEGKKNFKIQL